MAALVTYEREESVVRIGMDDGKLNLLSPQMLAELDEAFERASSEGVPVILRGREGVMSAGFDLKVLQGGDVGAAADLLKAGFVLSRRIFSFPTPVVVACTGHAIAMGLFLVMSGDYRIGVAGPFRVTANEVQIGMTLPRAAIDVCRHRLAHPYFDRVAALAEVFTPETALPSGIFSRVVDAAELDSVVDEVATTMTGLNMRAHEGTKLRAREDFLATLDTSIAADDVDFGPPSPAAEAVGRVKERTPELRNRVLGAAVSVLEDDGVGAFTARRLAAAGSTSTAAVYELFGDKAGLVREVFFEGFRMLRARFDTVPETPDPRRDLAAVIGAIRSFVRAHPALAEVMFSRPFADFDPGREETEAGASVREFIIGRVRRCVDAGLVEGNETDVAHVLLALAQGLCAQEVAGWLGSSAASIDRRWSLALDATLDGLSPRRPARRARRLRSGT